MTHALILGVLALTVGADPSVDAARAWRGAHGAEILRDYAEFLSIPNVSGDRPDIRRNAEFIRDRLRERGVETRLLELDGSAPIVFGRIDAPGATRTLGIYAHYDGQPVDASAWRSTAPFEPAIYDGPVEAGGARIDWPEPGDAIDPEWRLYARGSGDDKAPIMALLAALDALNAADLAPASNIIVFFEGEEEAGSANLGGHLAAAAGLIEPVDLWVICDGPVHQSRRPQLVFGVRGITSLEVTVLGAARTLHSGHYGNWAPNPAMDLARLLASMKDADGRVLVEGFYDSTVPPGPAERAAIARVPRIGPALRRELGLRHSEAHDAPYLERLMIPSLNVRGLRSATVGPTARNIVPDRATASIDVRLAKGNEPGAMLDLIERHIRGRGYAIVREEPTIQERLALGRTAIVTRGDGYRAVRTPMDEPAVAPVRRAVRRVAGQAPILVPTLGGSLPLYLFEERGGAPIVILPIANHDDNQHAPDENLRVANLWYGVDVMAAVLTAN